MIDYAIELGHKVIAITDHESISNAIKVEKYYKKVKEKNPNFKVIRGNEIYLVRNGLNQDNYITGQDKYFHFVLLAKDLIGHQQLREISTRAWIRSYMARGMRRVPTYYQDLIDIIGQNPGHIIGSTACLGGCLPTQLLRQRDEQSEALMQKIHVWIKQIDNIFGHGNFFFELQPSKNKDQIYVNKKLIELSSKFDIPYIITTDSHYLKKEDRIVHKAYLNAQSGEREVDDFYATTYMMETEELESYFSYLNREQIDLAYANINRIAEGCEDYSLLKPLKIPQLKWRQSEVSIDCKEWIQKIPMLEKFWMVNENGNYIDWPNSCLADEIIAGIHRHPDCDNEEAYREINECLEMTWTSSKVNNASWASYFLNLQQIIEECWEAGTLVGPSRGSGGGFILLYLLDITQINPLREKTKLYNWRFLNPDRVSPLDIDCDIEGGRRTQVLNHLRSVYGIDRVSNVITFGTEKSKSAILTAARGLGIDVDIAQYIASLIPADRGLLRTLDQCMNGDKEAGFTPIKQFVYEMTENYPELWEVARKIEGLVCRSGIHAGGVIFVDEPFTNSTALMRAPDGTIVTAFDLHDAEDASLIKMDLLSVEALDKIHNCLDLLVEYGYIENKPTLKEIYENTIGIYNLERVDTDMWKMIWEHKIESLFQMEKQSGIQGIAIAKPKNVDELAVLNSVIRLMAPEKNAEIPLNTWGRYREDISQWTDEMKKYGLTNEEINWLSNHNAITDGICECQEGLMALIREERLGGNSLGFADSARKALAKKIGPLFEKCEKEFYENAKAKGCSDKLVHYVWDVLLRVQRGYSFCRAHTLAYSLVALQEMNLAFKYPIIFWNCACLISDSGGNGGEEENGIEEETDRTIIWDQTSELSVVDFTEDDEELESEDDEDSDNINAKSKKSKSVRSTNYGKIATAIGKMRTSGIEVAPPNINKSSYTFSPDVDTSLIRFGMSGITKVGEDLIQSIIQNRPYESLEDFLLKVKINKPQMVNLIKCGAFDDFGERIDVMRQYIDLISDKKKRVTLQNMKMLIDFGLIPEEFDMQRRVFNFNKYLRKLKDDNYYLFDNIAMNFFSANFNIDSLIQSDKSESGFKINQKKWDDIYQTHMDKIRPWVKKNATDLLNQINNRIISETWDKYCGGSISKWEMDSVSCYFHAHELSNISYDFMPDLVEFFDLDEEPKIERIINIKGKQVPLFKIQRIIGTVLDKNKQKKTVTLLTNKGVVNVRIFGEVFNHYDRQISEVGADGKKHVIRKSEFSRGNKIIVTGIRRGDDFTAKTYKATPYHLVDTVEEIYENGLIRTFNRHDEV